MAARLSHVAQVAPYIPNEIYETVSSQLRPKDAFTEAWEAWRSEREAARRASVTATAQMVAQLRAQGSLPPEEDEDSEEEEEAEEAEDGEGELEPLQEQAGGMEDL